MSYCALKSDKGNQIIFMDKSDYSIKVFPKIRKEGFE